MNYEDVSDHRINALVTSIVFDCSQWEYNDAEFYHCGIDGKGYHSQPILNYCNNPSDAWPIMIENGIAALAENGEVYGATTDTYEYYDPHGNAIYSCEHKNPLRAAMIVFLMMNENK